MERCDVLVVGGGPAGSSCAGLLRSRGLAAVVLDGAPFPRDKVCAGWVTPPVLDRLGLSPEEYGREHVLQPFTGFLVGTIGGRPVETRYGRAVSYGVRRGELDDHLLRRTGARLRLGEPLRSLRRTADGWVANEDVEAPVVVGAGGHFCPTLRLTGFRPAGETVIAQAAEVRLSDAEARRCAVDPEVPELYFSPDLLGYGWCLRKGPWLNVGLGRVGDRNLGQRTTELLRFLRDRGRIPGDLSLPLKGHAYRLRSGAVAPRAAERLLRVGDAAGLADPKSGEGIGPAVESGLEAAERILAAGGAYGGDALGPVEAPPAPGAPGRRSALGPAVRAFLGRRLLATRWFTRRVVLERWFLGGCPGELPSGAGPHGQGRFPQ